MIELKKKTQNLERRPRYPSLPYSGWGNVKGQGRGILQSLVHMNKMLIYLVTSHTQFYAIKSHSTNIYHNPRSILIWTIKKVYKSTC